MLNHNWQKDIYSDHENLDIFHLIHHYSFFFWKDGWGCFCYRQHESPVVADARAARWLLGGGKGAEMADRRQLGGAFGPHGCMGVPGAQAATMQHRITQQGGATGHAILPHPGFQASCFAKSAHQGDPSRRPFYGARSLVTPRMVPDGEPKAAGDQDDCHHRPLVQADRSCRMAPDMQHLQQIRKRARFRCLLELIRVCGLRCTFHGASARSRTSPVPRKDPQGYPWYFPSFFLYFIFFFFLF